MCVSAAVQKFPNVAVENVPRCNSPSEPVPPGAAAVSLLLLVAPLGMIAVLKRRQPRSRSGTEL